MYCKTITKTRKPSNSGLLIDFISQFWLMINMKRLCQVISA